MDIKNFHNNSSNFLCGCVFYLSGNLMVIAYTLHGVLFKGVLNLIILFAIFLQFFKKRLTLLIFT